jgi:hypothetical protein
MRLGKYFTLEEFVSSQTATRRGIGNTPTPSVLVNLRDLVQNILDPLREQLSQPVVVSSGYRSPALNRAIGGANTSQHVEGQAADIQCPAIGTKRLFEFLRASELPFDQLIYEGSWVHVSFGPRHRREVLIATFTNGKVSYSRV